MLQTHTTDPMLSLCDVTRFSDDGYVARLRMRSGGFTLDRPFYFDEIGLIAFVAAIELIDRVLTGSAELCTPYEEENHIRLELNSRGWVVVTGHSREYSDLDQRLQFGFTTDQTVLSPFARDLKAACHHTT